MRSFLLQLFGKSPFAGLIKHAELIRDVAPVFRAAMIAYVDENWEEFEDYHNEVTLIESQGDGIKRNIRGHLPKGILLPMEKFQLLWYLREQDKLLDATQNALHWLSYRATQIPDELVDDLLFLVEKINEVQRAMLPMVVAAEKYFRSFSKKDRQAVKDTILEIREHESVTDQIERKLMADLLTYPFENPISVYHLIRSLRYMIKVSDHAENASDMLRAMIAR